MICWFLSFSFRNACNNTDNHHLTDFCSVRIEQQACLEAPSVEKETLCCRCDPRTGQKLLRLILHKTYTDYTKTDAQQVFCLIQLPILLKICTLAKFYCLFLKSRTGGPHLRAYSHKCRVRVINYTSTFVKTYFFFKSGFRDHCGSLISKLRLKVHTITL